KSEEEKRREIEAEMTALTAPTTPLTALAGIGAKTIEKMEAAGIINVEKLASMTPEQLMEIPGIGEKMVDKIYQAVNRFYESGGTEGAPAEAVENTDELAEEAETVAETAESAEAAVPAEAEPSGETEETAKNAEETEEATEAEHQVESGDESSEGESKKSEETKSREE